MKNRPYENLIAWKEAHLLCLWTYEVTKKYPSDERFRLIDQMCRSSTTAPTNIAEGSRKSSKKERAHFYEIAICTLEELHYQYKLSLDLRYISAEVFEIANDKIKRTSYLTNKLRSDCIMNKTPITSTTSTPSK